MSGRPELISDRLAVVLAVILVAASMAWLWFTPVADPTSYMHVHRPGAYAGRPAGSHPAE